MKDFQKLVLLPRPRKINFREGAPSTVASEPEITIDPKPRLLPEGYRLQVEGSKAHIVAGDEAGAFYGRMTLRQIARQCPHGVPPIEIEDWPDFASRGVMLDISRDKVPTMETLLALVDELAEWKVNELQLYTEHTFAYRNHHDVWAHASPVTADQLRQLDIYCRERFIELVPNQQSFGHMERWLKHPAYKHLAECPDGFEWPWGGHSPNGMTLDPTNPATITFLDELYGELLPNFKSSKLNVDGDEPWELGQGRSKPACDRKGTGRVYLEFFLKLREVIQRRGHTMHFWGDIIREYPELLTELPRDAVALEWGYAAGHAFDQHCGLFAGAGLPFYVCPGTSSWNSIAGRTDNCLANLRSAAVNGIKHGAIGFLNTDWGDNGHWQYLPVSYLGFAAGAALAWCEKTNHDADWSSVLDTHVFRDASGVMGRCVYDLGNIYQRTPFMKNAAALFMLLHEPAGHGIFQSVTGEQLRAVRSDIHTIMEKLNTVRMQRPDAGLIKEEFANAARMMLHGCDRADGGDRGALAAGMREILAEHRRLWLARNRPGGLDDSCRVLEQRLHEYTC